MNTRRFYQSIHTMSVTLSLIFSVTSGTTAAVAEKRWIVSRRTSDLGKFAIHMTRKRFIGVHRQLKEDSEDYRAFEILNLW